MDTRTKESTLGESRVISELIRNDYDVFIQFSGKSPFDIVAAKNNKLMRVEVKTTKRRNKNDTGWEVQLKSVRANRTANVIKRFDKTSCDILAVYIAPKDEVKLLDVKEISQTCQITIMDRIRLDEELVLKTSSR